MTSIGLTPPPLTPFVEKSTVCKRADLIVHNMIINPLDNSLFGRIYVYIVA
jgi:hypothetical protein